MAIKKIKIGETHGYIGDKPKTKPKPRVEIPLPDWCRERDICWYIQHGGECLWGEQEIEEVRGKYFNTLF